MAPEARRESDAPGASLGAHASPRRARTRDPRCTRAAAPRGVDHAAVARAGAAGHVRLERGVAAQALGERPSLHRRRSWARGRRRTRWCRAATSSSREHVQDHAPPPDAAVLGGDPEALDGEGPGDAGGAEVAEAEGGGDVGAAAASSSARYCSGAQPMPPPTSSALVTPSVGNALPSGPARSTPPRPRAARAARCRRRAPRRAGRRGRRAP